MPKQSAYLPTLGTVYYGKENPEKVLSDLLSIEEGKFLPYDKERRWKSIKSEKIDGENLIYQNGVIVIPVENITDNKIVKLYLYSKKEIQNPEILKSLLKKNIKPEVKVFCFSKPNNALIDEHIVFHKTLAVADPIVGNDTFMVKDFDHLRPEEKQTFLKLGEEGGLDGFRFLWEEYLRKNRNIGRIICAIERGKVIGAVGPVVIDRDAFGKLQLFPPYFGVISNYRRKGIGRRLWQEAMSRARKSGAEYLIFSSKVNSPAEHFYRKEGLSEQLRIYGFKL